MNFFKLITLLLLNFFFLPIYFLFFIICFLLTFLPIFPSKVAKKNIVEQLGLKGIKVNFLISLVYLGYIFYFFEAFLFETFHLNTCLFEKGFNFSELLKGVRQKYPDAKERGIVYILSHMGNVEMYSLPVLKEFTSGRHSKVYALAQPSRIKLVNKLLSWYRLRPGMGIIWTDKRLFSKMEEVIHQENASFCMLVDQKPKSGGLFIRFFGKYAAFPISGLRMCMNQNLIVIYASAYRILPGIMKLKMQCGKNPHLKEYTPNQSEHSFLSTSSLNEAELYHLSHIKEREKDVSLEMSYFVNWIENEIKSHPGQWSWDYKKWSREPSDHSKTIQQ
jgi:lauroyl/myristoyl acyltransferase